MAHLDYHIVGQSGAKKRLCVTMYQHYKHLLWYEELVKEHAEQGLPPQDKYAMQLSLLSSSFLRVIFVIVFYSM